MNSKPAFQLRGVSPDDHAELARWIAADRDHAGRVRPEFFTTNDAASECMAFTDQAGTVFYVRIERCLRIHMQFPPTTTKAEQARVREVLRDGFAWLVQQGKEAGFRELIFQSTVAPLIRFCEKRFGFRKSPSELTCSLVPTKTQETQEQAAHHVRQAL